VEELNVLHATLRARPHGARLRDLSVRQLAAFALAVRIAVKRVQHGETSFEIGNCKRLLSRLEAARKRAKRIEVRRCGDAERRANAAQWQSFVKWLRRVVVPCRCTIRRRTVLPGRTRRQREYVGLLTQRAISALEAREFPVPEPEVRKYVRMALAYIRRGRTPFGVRTILEDEILAQRYLADFIVLRIHKQEVKKGRTN
jgi:hypothetical protein